MSYKGFIKVLFVHVLYFFCLVVLNTVCPGFLAIHCPANIEVLGWPDNSFWLSLHWEGGKPMFQKKRGNEEKNEGAHMWALWRGQAINAFPPHRILLNPVTWPVVGTYGSWGFFVTTINPPGISWQCPFDDRKLLEANWTKSCVLIMKGVAGSLWTAMSHSITIGYMSLHCLPGDKWNYVQNN